MVPHDWDCKLVALAVAFSFHLPTILCQDYVNWYDEAHHPPRIQDLPDDLPYENLSFTNEGLDALLHFLASNNGSRSFSDFDFFSNGGIMDYMKNFAGGFEAKKDPDPEDPNDSDNKLFFNLRMTYVARAQGTEFYSRQGFMVFENKFGEFCDPLEPRPCEHSGYVSCIETATDIYGKPMYSCACDYLHTQIEPLPFKPPCVKNVNTKCTNGHFKYQCGENMECLPDVMELDTESYCYCKDGFAPAKNALGILGLCRPILKDNETEEEEEDYSESHAAFPAGRHYLRGMFFMSSAAIALFAPEP